MQAAAESFSPQGTDVLACKAGTVSAPLTESTPFAWNPETPIR
jgi:hypothetical protein